MLAPLQEGGNHYGGGRKRNYESGLKKKKARPPPFPSDREKPAALVSTPMLRFQLEHVRTRAPTHSVVRARLRRRTQQREEAAALQLKTLAPAPVLAFLLAGGRGAWQRACVILRHASDSSSDPRRRAQGFAENLARAQASREIARVYVPSL